MLSRSLLLVLIATAVSTNAFTIPQEQQQQHQQLSQLKLSPQQQLQYQSRRGLSSLRASTDDDDEEDDLDTPKMNPNNPNLPELKGDFDWDEKFGDDDDWITENVPGKIVLNEVELAKQVTALSQLEEKWRKEREIKEYKSSRKTGFVELAELTNGRFAMFFLATGLLTELWTGVSMPGQVEEMLRIGGFIGFD